MDTSRPIPDRRLNMRMGAVSLVCVAAAVGLAYVLRGLLVLPGEFGAWPQPRATWAVLYTVAICLLAAVGLAALALVAWESCSVLRGRVAAAQASRASPADGSRQDAACDPFASTLPDDRLVTRDPTHGGGIAGRKTTRSWRVPDPTSPSNPTPPAAGPRAAGPWSPLSAPLADALSLDLRRLIAASSKRLHDDATDLQANCLDISALSDSTLRSTEQLCTRVASLRQRIETCARTARNMDALWSEVDDLLARLAGDAPPKDGPSPTAPGTDRQASDAETDGSQPASQAKARRPGPPGTWRTAQLAADSASTLGRLREAQRSHAATLNDIAAATGELARDATAVNRMTSSQVAYGQFAAHTAAGLAALVERLRADVERLHEPR